MGGGPKINTGVSWVDNTSNNALGVATGGLAGNGLDSIGKNLERNAQTMINTTAALTQPGGLNNIGQTMAQQAAIMLSGGLADNNDMKKAVGESNIDRKQRETVDQTAEQAAAYAAADIAAAAAESKRGLESVISGSVDRKRRSPGRALSLLSGGTSGTNTLLDIGKKS